MLHYMQSEMLNKIQKQKIRSWGCGNSGKICKVKGLYLAMQSFANQ